ncbi:MAG: phage major capsid protein [Woeseiaceae bacterium]
MKVRFSSEYPVQRFVNGELGDEVLEHRDAAVDLGRLNDGAAVLVDHRGDQVGVVEEAHIYDDDGVGRALLRFGQSVRASEIFQDIVDRIRRNISVGYQVNKWRTERADDVVTHFAERWTPHEISLVAVPADPSAQVGRSQSLETIEAPIMSVEEAKPVLSDDEKRQLESNAVGVERNRWKDIEAIARAHDLQELGQKAIDDGTSADDFRRSVLDEIEKNRASKPATDIGMSRGEIKNWSLFRACEAIIAGTWSAGSLEKEASDEIARKLDREPNGLFVPWEIQTERQAIHDPGFQGGFGRVMTVGTDTAGGFLKGTDHLAGSFIELLRAKTLLGSLGARVLPGLVGDIEIPRLDTGSVWYHVGEDVDGTLSDLVLGQVTLSPTTVTGQVPISRRLLKQSAPSVEQLVLGDLAAGAAQVLDLMGFEGSGASSQPTGIMNQSGIGTVSIATFATTAYPTHAEIVEFETDVAAANADLGSLAYVTTAAIRGAMKTTAIDAGSGIMLGTNGQTNGYPLHVKTNLAAKTILYGNYQDAVFGLWGVLDVEPDKAAKAAAGGLVLRAFQDYDFAIRHAGSFSKGTA